MNIGIDVDGVLVDVAGYQLKYGKKYFSTRGHEVVNPEGFDIEDIFGCTHKERSGFWHRYIWKYSLYEPAAEYAAAVIRRLHKEGHRIVIITSRAYTAEKNFLGAVFRKMLLYWLKKNRVYYDDIVYCSETNSGEDKLRACIDKHIDIMIDDKPENLSALSEQLKVICYPAIWNRNIDNKQFIRVTDWKDVYRKINEINRSGFYGK